jgi:cytochrome c oxidase subunit 4
MGAAIAFRVLVWLGLMALLALTIGVTFAPLGAWRFPISLAIAAVKAALVVWVFMELRAASGATRLVLVAALVALGLLMLLSGLDAAIRAV